MKMIGSAAVMAGAFALPALGFGTGVANAEQPLADSPSASWKLDRPHDRDWDDWDDGWRGRGWHGPPHHSACAWVPPAVSAWVPPAVC